MPSFPVLVLGFLFVSFRPSRFRSHSCSTGASLLFRFLSSASLPGFPLTSAPFRSLTLGSDYSAFRAFLSPLPDLPRRRFPRCQPVSFVPDPLLFRPACFHAVLPIPVLSFLQFPFSARCFVSQALHSCQPPVSSSAAPLAFALGSGYLALSFWVLVPRSDLTYISTRCRKCQHLFFIFFNYYLVYIYQFSIKHQNRVVWLPG